jgi:hypothetical protein
MSEREATETARPPQACEAKLFPAERLLFAALRAWATARIAGERPHSHVADALAEKASPRVGSVFLAWIQAVEAGSRRPLALTCGHCGGMSTDAQRLIVACGLAPTDRRLAEALLAPVVHEPGMVMMLSRSLNAALAAAGWPLPARGLEGEVAPQVPERTTLH